MTENRLKTVLRWIREGQRSEALVEEARALLVDTPLGHALPIDDLFCDEPSEDAEQLMMMLGFEEDHLSALLSGALEPEEPVFEASFDEEMGSLTDAIMAGVTSPSAPNHPSVEDPVLFEAGDPPEVVEGGVEVEPAVRYEAGEAPDVGAAHREVPLAPAVGHEAGQGPDVGLVYSKVDVSPAVHHEAGTVADLGAEYSPDAVPVSAATYWEAGRVAIASGLGVLLDWANVPVREAVTQAAGRVELSTDVMRLLGIESLQLRPALLASAGPAPRLWSAVSQEIGAPSALPISDAVVAFAGEVDVTASVMKTLGLERPAAVSELPEVPAAANNNWWIGAAVAIAAVALLFLGNTPEVTNTPIPHIAQTAKSDEVSVERVSGSGHAVVEMANGDDRPLIIWVNEGV